MPLDWVIPMSNRSKGTAGQARDEARLVVLAGTGKGRRHAIEGEAVIGRSASCDVMLDDGDVSRRHARISRMPDGSYFIEDLHSRNGTSLDGVPVEGRVPLDFGAKVQIGSQLVLQFTRVNPGEQQERQTERLQVMGRVGAGVAHDINNMLSVVLATVDYLRGLPERRIDDEVLTCLEDIDAAARRASQLTPRFAALSRSNDDAHELIDLSLVCREVYRLVERTFPRSIRVEADIGDGLRILGNTAEIHQVLMNLCINARDAMPSGGVLAITARRIRTSENGHKPDVMVMIRDTGHGSPQADDSDDRNDNHSSIQRAYGLGLATVHDIIEHHGGFVDAQASKDDGTVFIIQLPSAPSHSGVEGRRRNRSTVRASKDRLVLLVDDEPLVRRSAARQLRAAGFEVIEAASGGEAIEIYESERTPDIVLLDLDMPELNGEETLQRLREIDPGVTAMAVSGHDDPARVRGIIALGAVMFVGKPWEPGELANAVADALATSRPTPVTIDGALSS